MNVWKPCIPQKILCICFCYKALPQWAMVQVAKNEASKGFDTFWPVLYLLFKFITNLKISKLLTLMIWNIYCQNSGRTWNVFSNLKPQPWTSPCLAKVAVGKESVKLPCGKQKNIQSQSTNKNLERFFRPETTTPASLSEWITMDNRPPVDVQ